MSQQIGCDSDSFVRVATVTVVTVRCRLTVRHPELRHVKVGGGNVHLRANQTAALNVFKFTFKDHFMDYLSVNLPDLHPDKFNLL